MWRGSRRWWRRQIPRVRRPRSHSVDRCSSSSVRGSSRSSSIRSKELARKTLDLADLPVVVATADDHQVNTSLFHRTDLAIPEAFIGRGPDAGRERRAGTQRTQLATVLGDALGRLKPDEEA